MFAAWLMATLILRGLILATLVSVTLVSAALIAATLVTTVLLISLTVVILVTPVIVAVVAEVIALVVALVVALVGTLIILLPVTLTIALVGLAVLLLLFKARIQNAVIVIGMLEIIFREHAVARRTGVARHGEELFHQLLSIAPHASVIVTSTLTVFHIIVWFVHQDAWTFLKSESNSHLPLGETSALNR